MSIRVVTDGGIRTIALDRPPLNILDIVHLEELRDALLAAAADPEARVLVLTGRGKAFCAGVDVSDHTGSRVQAMIRAFHGVLEALESVPCPVVAVVNGHALGGGCELVLAADIAIVRDGAKLGQPEIRLGVFPPAALALLPRLVGRQRAMDLTLSGRTMEASEALDMGLVARLLPAEDFEREVRRYVEDLASLSGPVLRLTKRVLLEGIGESADRALDLAEEAYLSELMALDDAHEGIRAFMEKRDPVWNGA